MSIKFKVIERGEPGVVGGGEKEVLCFCYFFRRKIS